IKPRMVVVFTPAAEHFLHTANAANDELSSLINVLSIHGAPYAPVPRSNSFIHQLLNATANPKS
ncbi:TPA: hypothetical protein ACGEYS_000001, partial [Kluyvera cryocrescens]